MKVLLIAPQPFFRVRGTPINIRNVVESLVLAGHEVDLLCYPFGEPYDYDGVQVHRSPGFIGISDVKVGPSAAKIPLDGLMFFKAWSLCAKNAYDVVHAVEESAFFAVFLAKMYKTKLIYDMDSCISDQLAYSGKLTFKPLLRMIEAMERGVLRRADIALTVCKALSDTARNLVPEVEIHQIEDAPLDEELIQMPDEAEALREQYGIAAEQKVVLYTGNFESYQGVELLVDAISHVPESVAAVFMFVGGQPDQVDALKSRAEVGGVAKRCIFTGLQPITSMPAYLTLADVLTAPRVKGSNTALKIYGYMQSGRPIVATNLETHTQVLDESLAVLVAPEPAALAQGLVEVLDDPEKARGLAHAAQRVVEEQYSLKHFRRRVAEAYDSLGK